MPHPSPRYHLFQLDLTAARVNEAFDLAGGFLFMRAASAAGSNITIRFDSPTADAVPFKKGDKREGKFRTLYISNAAQSGRTLDILITEGPEEFTYELAVEISTISLIDTVTTIVDPVTISGAVRLDQWDEEGVDSAKVTNPASGAVIVTTGDLLAGTYALDIYYTSSFNPSDKFELQFRDSADVIKEKIGVFGNQFAPNPTSLVLKFAANEDFVFKMIAAATGDLEAFLAWRRFKP